MTLPNFIISGFPKCGTTSLHYYLSEHPDIYMAKQKELHFFTNRILSNQNEGAGDRLVAERHVTSLNQYYEFFANAEKYKSVGETSPSYINYPEFFREIKTKLSDPKIIVLTRDPIKRAYSNYLHLVREGREKELFEEALKLEKKRKELKYSDFWYYKFNSTYYKKIKKAIEVFSEVLILTQEELMLNPENTIKKTYKFLEVDERFSPNILNKKYNPGGTYKNNISTRIIFKPSKVKNFIKRIVPVYPWMKDILNSITEKHKTPSEKINESTKKELIRFFKNDVNLIKKLGVNVTHWTNYNQQLK